MLHWSCSLSLAYLNLVSLLWYSPMNYQLLMYFVKEHAQGMIQIPPTGFLHFADWRSAGTRPGKGNFLYNPVIAEVNFQLAQKTNHQSIYYLTVPISSTFPHVLNICTCSTFQKKLWNRSEKTPRVDLIVASLKRNTEHRRYIHLYHVGSWTSMEKTRRLQRMSKSTLNQFAEPSRGGRRLNEDVGRL